MPELPDVEIFRQYMNSTALHQKIDNVQVMDDALLGDVSSRSLQMQLKDQQFESTKRHGKYLFAETDESDWLVLHFGMTGFLKYYKKNNESPAHTRVRFDFSNGYHLDYDCQRKLGFIDLVPNVDNYIQKKDLGIDPYKTPLDLGTLKELLKGRRGSIKSFLMNQSIIAGIGNIYSDEILFHAKVHPKSEAAKVDDAALKSMLHWLQKVCDTAIEQKADPSRLPDSYLLPHREEGATCPHCQHKIAKATISGRSAYYCTHHQKLYSA